MTQRDSLVWMSRSKAVDRQYTERAGDIIRKIVDDDFQGNQTHAAKRLGISQGQVSDLYNKKPSKGVGLGTLLALRAYTDRSIDDLLGLGPLPSEDAITTMKRSIDVLEARVNALPPAEATPPLKKQPAKKWHPGEEARLHARGQTLADEKQRAKKKPGTRQKAG